MSPRGLSGIKIAVGNTSIGVWGGSPKVLPEQALDYSKSVPDYRWFCDSGYAYALRSTEL